MTTTTRITAYICILIVTLTVIYYYISPPVTKPAPPLTTLQAAGQTMGTTWKLIIRQKGGNPNTTQHANTTLQHQTQQFLDQYEAELSHWKPNSWVSKFKQHHTTEPYPASPTIIRLITAAQTIHQQTYGAYDITVGPLVNAWGFGPDNNNNHPTPQTIQQLKQNLGLNLIKIIPGKPPAIRKLNPNVQLDFSSLAKGDCIDQLLLKLQQNYPNADIMIEIGGEIKTIAKHRSWNIGIESTNSQTANAPTQSITLNNLAIATSGNYRQFKPNPTNPSQQISHIIDPRTAQPTSHTTIAVSVIHPTAMLADAYATALMVLSPKESWRIATEQNLPTRITYRNQAGHILSLYTNNFPAPSD